MNMIEKVARAMLEADAHAYPDEYMIGFSRRLELAKAAIEAMREPTAEMLEAAIDWHDHVAADETYPMARSVMRAAVGAALDEK